ncbi:nesp142 [Neophasia sp. alphabaculovirus]|nr:nesp142 [Neophasia sp. alphabaculovirus]
MNRPIMRTANAPVIVSNHDYDREQIRRDLNSLRRSVHELCTRSTTGFDCNRILESSSSSNDVITKSPVIIKNSAATVGQSALVCDKV